ncbi:hypothetical protein EJ05DRAFT_496122 [Pseudovirgaria hyperparasitica]|uniref:Uncharacterized protein n=1 Tax=Pseudovirgaria hyperparasitica TaxID=470096 RepID=A0A6A6WME4_9PEZI|nr:uncharacterized protein EJ05DRAFT_496122 [Pseudovirgaria hyperparasitica]KAF2763296.1 hypothetical protein EJ05DRAFT_496122 [Pseudovirgaria hyperparasitica]
MHDSTAPMNATSIHANRLAQAAQVHTGASSSSSAAPRPVTHVARSSMGKRIVLPAVAAIVVGSAIVALNSEFKSTRRSDPMQAQNNSLMDSYGDKDSLEDLQKAMEAYEKR